MMVKKQINTAVSRFVNWQKVRVSNPSTAKWWSMTFQSFSYHNTPVVMMWGHYWINRKRRHTSCFHCRDLKGSFYTWGWKTRVGKRLWLCYRGCFFIPGEPRSFGYFTFAWGRCNFTVSSSQIRAGRDPVCFHSRPL